MYWQRSTGYNKYCFEICLDGTIIPVRNFIPFDEMKQKAIEYYKTEIEELTNKIKEL